MVYTACGSKWKNPKAREETTKAIPKEYLPFTAVCKKPRKVNSSHIPAKSNATITKAIPDDVLLAFASMLLDSSTALLGPKIRESQVEMKTSKAKMATPNAIPNRMR